MTAPGNARGWRRPAGLLLTVVGVLVLAADAVISVPSAIPVLRDPSSHEAQDAGMAAIFMLIPLASVGILCLALGYSLWSTRAGGVLLVTALAVVGIVILNLGGGPLLWLAIGVAIAGTLLAASLGYRDWVASRNARRRQ